MYGWLGGAGKGDEEAPLQVDLLHLEGLDGAGNPWRVEDDLADFANSTKWIGSKLLAREEIWPDQSHGRKFFKACEGPRAEEISETNWAKLLDFLEEPEELKDLPGPRKLRSGKELDES